MTWKSIRYSVGFAGAALLFGASSASAQFNGTPILPSDGFHRAAPPARPQPVQNARPPRDAKQDARPGQDAKPREDARRPAAVSTSAEPTYDEGTIARLEGALQRYQAIAAAGGWPTLPKDARLAPGSQGPDVETLSRRLMATGDLDPRAAAGDLYDDRLAAAVKRFQARHGLAETGSVGPQTAAALNVPAAKRVSQLASSLDRLREMSFSFGERYVVVNIPAAMVEAVASGRVERRHVAVVGKKGRQSPTLTTLITAVNLNPTWTVPLSIAKKDIIPRLRKDPRYLARMHMRLLDAQGNEIDPRSVDWSSNGVHAFTIRQDAGAWNALGALRIDMPNRYAVYMHDTNHRNLFSSDYRFQSSGCTRVHNPRDLAAWILQDTPGWSRKQIDAGIASGRRIDVRLAHKVPVAWIYLTGWASRDGTVNFRNDVYNLDTAPVRPFMVSLPPSVVVAARRAGFTLQSGESRPLKLKEVHYLDSR